MTLRVLEHKPPSPGQNPQDKKSQDVLLKICDKRAPQLQFENQLEIEFLYGKRENFDINSQIIYFHLTHLSHTKIYILYLQMKMYYKVCEEINYKDTNTFSIKIVYQNC